MLWRRREYDVRCYEIAWLLRCVEVVVCGSGGGVGSGIIWGLVDIDNKGPCENVGPA